MVFCHEVCVSDRVVLHSERPVEAPVHARKDVLLVVGLPDVFRLPNLHLLAWLGLVDCFAHGLRLRVNATGICDCRGPQAHVSD